MADHRRLDTDLLIDTNVFLSFLNREDTTPWKESVLLMNHIAFGDIHAFVTRFSLHTIAVKVSYQRNPERLAQLAAFLAHIDYAEGLTVYDTSTLEEQRIVDSMTRYSLDFDDALQYFVASELGLTLVSFDADFDQTDVERIEPKDCLERLKR